MLDVTGSASATVKSLPLYDMRQDMANIYLPDEEMMFAFQDEDKKSYVITDRRIITVETLKGRIKSFTFLPHSKLQCYAIECIELNSHAEKGMLYLLYTNGFEFVMKFNEDIDLEAIQHVLALCAV